MVNVKGNAAGIYLSRRKDMAYQAEEPVCIENEISLVGLDIPDDGVHASGLVVAGHNLQIVIDAPQVWLLQLHAYMLCNQINCNDILLPAPICMWCCCSCRRAAAYAGKMISGERVRGCRSLTVPKE